MKKIFGTIVMSYAIIMLSSCDSDTTAEEQKHVDDTASEYNRNDDPKICPKDSLQRRPESSCDEIIASQRNVNEKIDGDFVYTEDTWDDVPSYLQVLPPDGTLCGDVKTITEDEQENEALNVGATVIISTAYCDEPLFDIYEAILVETGCSPGKREMDDTLFTWLCPDDLRMVRIAIMTHERYIRLSTFPR